jgi:myotubularin-related protein 1/2
LQWGGQRSAQKKEAEADRGPAFIQFLDCVFQLTNIYPLSFQFRQSLLVFLAEQVYSNHFGNFLILSKTLK